MIPLHWAAGFMPWTGLGSMSKTPSLSGIKVFYLRHFNESRSSSGSAPVVRSCLSATFDKYFLIFYGC